MTTLQADLTLGFEPATWLGAPSPGGLALPSAIPSATTMYGPRGVWFDDDRLIVCDSGNHRVLIWWRFPEADHAPADVVLGQPGFSDEGPKLLRLPTCAAMIDGRLFVADAWHHRIVVWNTLPESNHQPPDYVIGQPDLDSLEPNRGGRDPGLGNGVGTGGKGGTPGGEGGGGRGTPGGGVNRYGLFWPYGFGMAAGRFFLADTGNRRVLVWPGPPAPGQPPTWLIGQDDWGQGSENRGGPVGPLTFRWPHAIAGDGESLNVADAGNHRVLVWADAGAACAGAGPDAVLGQTDFASARDWPYGPQGPDVQRSPYGISLDAGVLAVADTANNRILLHRRALGSGLAGPADGVLAQPDFAANGENQWQAVRRDTLCWPYGVCLRGDRLAIADSGNNRVMIWKRRDSRARFAPVA